MSYFNAFPILYAADLAKALVFYRDLLGFRQTFQFPADGQPEFVALVLEGGGSLALAAAKDGQLGAHGRPMHPGDGGRFELCVYTDDVDRAIAELAANGVPVLAPPADQPLGRTHGLRRRPRRSPSHDLRPPQRRRRVRARSVARPHAATVRACDSAVTTCARCDTAGE